MTRLAYEGSVYEDWRRREGLERTCVISRGGRLCPPPTLSIRPSLLPLLRQASLRSRSLSFARSGVHCWRISLFPRFRTHSEPWRCRNLPKSEPETALIFYFFFSFSSHCALLDRDRRAWPSCLSKPRSFSPNIHPDQLPLLFTALLGLSEKAGRRLRLGKSPMPSTSQ